MPKRKGGKNRRSSNPNIQPLSGLVPAGKDVKKVLKEEEDVPSNMDDFVSEVIRRANEDEHREEVAYIYSSKNQGKRQFLISPDGKWKRRWDWIMTLGIIASVLFTPLLLGFSDAMAMEGMLAGIIVIDATWWLDMLLSFRTAIKAHHGAHSMAALMEIMQPSRIAWHYLSTDFTLDLIAGLPYYAVLFHSNGLVASKLAGNPHAYYQKEGLFVLSLMPMLCLLRLRRVVRSKHVRSYLLADTDTNQLIRLVALFVYQAHCMGCLFWLMSIVELRHAWHRHGILAWAPTTESFLPPQSYASYLPMGLEALQGIQNGTVPGELMEPSITIYSSFASYVYALVWGAVNVSGVNFCKPANFLQSIIALMTVVCCILTNAVIIGSVTTTLSRLNYARHTEHQKRQAIEAHLKHHEVPRGLRRRVQEFYTFIGGVAEAQSREQLMPSLPKGLAFQLDLLQKRDVFTKVPFFRDCTHELIMDLVPRLERMFAMPGRTIIREGRVALGMYMIMRGRIRIMKEGRVLNERIVGEFIGENSLLTENREIPAAATCITTVFCELFILRRSDFEELAVQFPELPGRIRFFASRKDKVAHQAATTKHMRMQLKKEEEEERARHARSSGRFSPEVQAQELYRQTQQQRERREGVVRPAAEGVKRVAFKAAKRASCIGMAVQARLQGNPGGGSGGDLPVPEAQVTKARPPERMCHGACRPTAAIHDEPSVMGRPTRMLAKAGGSKRSIADSALLGGGTPIGGPPIRPPDRVVL